jgi:hypothetical protein
MRAVRPTPFEGNHLASHMYLQTFILFYKATDGDGLTSTIVSASSLYIKRLWGALLIQSEALSTEYGVDEMMANEDDVRIFEPE